MKSDSNNHRTTPRSGNRNDAQGSVVTKGNSIGQSGTGNRYSVQSAYLSAINAKSSNYTVNNENAYPEYRPSKPIIITNQQQTFNTSHANAATTTAIANSATAKLISNNSKVDSNTSTSTTAANATTSKSQTTNVKKMENLQSRSLLHVSTLGRYDGDPEEKSPLNASNHALRGGSHHYRVQSRYLAAIHGSKSNDSVGGGMLENAHPTHSPLHKSSMMMSSIERSAPPTAAQHTSSDNMSAIELKRQYLLNRERSLSKSRDASESGDVIPLPNSKSNDDDEGGCCGGGGGGGKSSVSASTSGQRDMQSIYLSALKPSLGHKSAVELQKEYLMSRSFSQSLDDEGGLGKGMGMDTDRSGEERSPLITTNQANSKKKKNNSNSSSSSVQSMYLSASNPHSEYTSTATSAISSSPIVNLQPTSSNDSYGQQSSHDDTECVLSSRSIQQVASADMVDDGDMDHALREEGSTIIKPSIDTAASGVSSSDSKDAVRVTPVIETTTLKDNLLSGIVVLNQDHQQQQQQSVPIDSIPTHVPHGIMNTPTHIATQLVTPSPPIPVVVKDYTVLTTQSYPPCHDDILSALELEIMTLMRTEGWSRETAVRILLAKSSSESHSKANTTSDQQQNTNNNNNNIMNNKNNNNNNNNYRSAVKGALSHTNMLSNDRHILGMTANNASNYHYPLSYSTSHQLVVSEQQHQGKVEGKIQWRQYQNHPMRGSQQSNSHHHHHHHAAVENASSSHTNRMFDHQLYIKETQKAPTNHHSVVTQEKQPHQHRVVQSQHQGVPSSSSSLVGFYQISGQGQGQGQGHHRGIPRSHARFAAAPDEGPDWGSLSSLSLSGSECEEGTESEEERTRVDFGRGITAVNKKVLSSLDEEEQVQLALRISLQQCSHGTTSTAAAAAAAASIDNSETINGFRTQMNLQQLISAGYTRTEAMHILRGNGAMNLLREKERVNRRNGHHTQLHKSSDAPLPLHSSCSTSRGGDKAGTQQNSKQQQQQQQLPTSGPVHPVPSMTTDHQHRPINHNHSYNNNTDHHHHHHHHRDGNKKKDLEVVASRGIIPRNTNFISLSPPPPTSIPTQSQTLHPADDHRQQQRQPKKTTFLSRFF